MKRAALFVHRWLGVGLSLFFLLWFPSGIGMMYWDFPSVTPADRLRHARALDASSIILSPADAFARTGATLPPSQARLNSFNGRPAYRFRTGREERLVYADTGEAREAMQTPMTRQIAAAWTGLPAADAREEPIDVDQWTVQGAFRSQRPLWKYSWADGQQVYVSQSSGEVVQYTTTASRLGAWAGAIPHWLYFTPLRAHPQQWSQFVIWSSGIGTLTAIIGVTLGIWTFRVRYRGWKRWHVIVGLAFGVAAATWAFSGMLSMDPFPMPSSAPVPRALTERPRLDRLSAKLPADAIHELAPLNVKELELVTFDDAPAYIATVADGSTRVVTMEPATEAPRSAFDEARLRAIAAHALGDRGHVDVSVLDRYDRYYIDRNHRRPLPVLLARTDDAAGTRVYIDPATARVVYSYSSRTWMSRWLYHGLHSLDFPWLYDHRPLWDIVMIVCMLGGTALSVTSVVLGWRVLGRALR